MAKRKRNSDSPQATIVGTGCLAIFGLIFFLAGLMACYSLALYPKIQIWRSANWIEAPCTINELKIVEHPSSESTTYDIKAQYSYVFNGRGYTGDRFWFTISSDSNKASKQKRIDDFIERSKQGAVCLVNPSNPSESVLTREVPDGQWFGLFLGGIFMLVGIGLPIQIIRARMRPKNSRPDGNRPEPRSVALKGVSMVQQNDTCPIETRTVDEPLVIEPKISRLGAAVGLWMFGTGWTALFGTIIYFVGFKGRDWMPLIILSVFLLIGVAVLFGAVVATLKVLNPKPTVVLSQTNIYAGSEFEISWLFKGKTSSIRKLSIVLEGKEKVSYRQGTNTRTEEAPFYKKVLADITEAERIREGYEVVTLPSMIMHTFTGTHNKIEWRLLLKGDVPRWPDITDEFPFIVLAPPVVTEGAQ